MRFSGLICRNLQKAKFQLKKASINHNKSSLEYDLIEIVKICVFIIVVLLIRKKFLTILMFVIRTIFALSQRSLFDQSAIKSKLYTCISIFDTVH